MATSITNLIKATGAQPLPYPIVLLHGWGVDESVWTPIQTKLSQWADVIVLHLAYEDASPAQYCQRLITLLPEKSLLIGWSLGGMLATQIAALSPQRVMGLVTLASNGQFIASENWPHAMPVFQFEGFLAAMENNPQRQLKRFLSLVANNDAEQKQQIQWLQAINAGADSELSNGLSLLASIDNSQSLRTLKLPALYCFGKCDAIVPVAAAELIRPHLQARQRIHVLEQAGHCLHYPGAACLSLIEDFCRDLKTGLCT